MSIFVPFHFLILENLSKAEYIGMLFSLRVSRPQVTIPRKANDIGRNRRNVFASIGVNEMIPRLLVGIEKKENVQKEL